MTGYIIFISAPYNPHRTYWQSMRKGEKGISVSGNRADMLKKLEELKSAGEHILRVYTFLGRQVNV